MNNPTKSGKRYFGEIHTNSRPRRADFERRLDDVHKAPILFLNLQGVGLSDDYSFDRDLRESIDDFYYSEFPTPGFWEIPGSIPDYTPVAPFVKKDDGRKKPKKNKKKDVGNIRPFQTGWRRRRGGK